MLSQCVLIFRSEGLIKEGMCSCCRGFSEDVNHLFWYCHFANKIWKMSNIWPCISGFARGGIGDLFQWISEYGKVGELEVFVLIRWSLWTKRNLVVFQGKMFDYEDVIVRANRMKESCKIFEAIPERIRDPPSSSSSSGFYKINVDAAVCNFSNQFSVGMVGRGLCGTLMFAEDKFMQGNLSAELVGLRVGLLVAIKFHAGSYGPSFVLT